MKRPEIAATSETSRETLGRNTAWFLLSLGMALGLTLLVKEPAFTDSQTYVLFLLFLAALYRLSVSQSRRRDKTSTSSSFRKRSSVSCNKPL